MTPLSVTISYQCNTDHPRKVRFYCQTFSKKQIVPLIYHRNLYSALFLDDLCLFVILVKSIQKLFSFCTTYFLKVLLIIMAFMHVATLLCISHQRFGTLVLIVRAMMVDIRNFAMLWGLFLFAFVFSEYYFARHMDEPWSDVLLTQFAISCMNLSENSYER